MHIKQAIIPLVLGGSLAVAVAACGPGAASSSPAPAKTVTQPVKVPVPGPTVTQQVEVPAPPPPTGTVIATFSGHGTQNTPAFNVPASGDYIVKWSYSHNADSSGGNNFMISDTNNTGMAGSSANEIAASGSGSTEDTGMSGSQSFNVEAIGDWTITVISAS